MSFMMHCDFDIGTAKTQHFQSTLLEGSHKKEYSVHDFDTATVALLIKPNCFGDRLAALIAHK